MNTRDAMADRAALNDGRPTHRSLLQRMLDSQDIVVGMIALNNGRLVGRTRLQKQSYLMDRCGANFGLWFTYHHYGPYSCDLARAVKDATSSKRIQMEERPGRHGVPYAIFTSFGNAEPPEHLGNLGAKRASELLTIMGGFSDVALEIAATVVFLHDHWDYFGKPKVSAIDETKRRKSVRATDKGIAEAIEMLHRLGLGDRVKAAA